MRATLTISLPTNLVRELGRETRARGATRSAVVREALEDHLWRLRCERVERTLEPLARRAGIYTEEDVFRLVS